MLLKRSAISGDILVDAVVRVPDRFVVACTGSGYSGGRSGSILQGLTTDRGTQKFAAFLIVQNSEHDHSACRTDAWMKNIADIKRPVT